MKFILLSALLTLGLSAQANVYKIDTTASKIGWKGTKKLGSFHNGHISVKEGQVEMTPKNEIKGGSIVIDMKTMTNEDLKADPGNQKKLVGHLSSGDFFNVEKFPTATFKITSVKSSGKGKATLKGDFTMIGNTQPAEVTVDWKEENGVATATGKMLLNRTKWGLKYGSGNFFKELTADKIINDEFEIDFNITAKK